jgi:hypothetical protein
VSLECLGGKPRVEPGTHIQAPHFGKD